MKQQIAILIITLSLIGCATGRMIIEDQMQTRQEVINHTQTECDYWRIELTKCNEWKDALVKIWELKVLAGQQLDGDAVRAWALAKFLKG